MSFSLASVKLSGNPDTSGWSQTFEYKPSDHDKLAKRGYLFVLISTSLQGEGLDKVVVGREIISRVNEEYFGKLEEEPLIALRKALKKVISEFITLGDIEIAAASFLEDRVFVAVGGGSAFYLFRNGGFFKIIESKEGEVVSASGGLQDKDIFVFGTKVFFQSFLRSEIKAVLQNGNLDAVSQVLASHIHSKDQEGRLGAIVLSLSKNLKEGNLRNMFQEEITNEINLNGANLIGEKTAPPKSESNFFGNLKKRFVKNIYLKGEGYDNFPKAYKKTSFLVGILLLVLLFTSVFFGIREKRIADIKSSYEEKLKIAEHELQESYNLYFLNPQRSRELFSQARSRVLGISSLKINDSKYNELVERVKEGEEKILGQYKVTAQLFVDLTIFSEGFEIDDLAVSSGIAYLLDEEDQKIIKVDLSKKSTETFAGPAKVGKSWKLAAYSGRVFVLGEEGLFEIGDERVKIDQTVDKDSLISSYAGNIYLLDRVDSNIYRYSSDGFNFGTKKKWLKDDLDLNLADARILVIDGSLWVVKDKKDIFKFSLGNLSSFEMSGIFPEVEEITDFYTNERCENLYFWEKGKERVVVTTKGGEYKAQYLVEGVKDIQRLIVLEEEKKLFLLSKEKIFYFDLKHF